MLNIFTAYVYIGVVREWTSDRVKSSEDQWIRHIEWLSETHFIVICCTYDQAKLFVEKGRCIEMDLSFKMIQGKTNVFSISGWDTEAHRKLLSHKSSIC